MKVLDIPSLARFIMSDACQSIVVLTGAGVSVASGIPDFRSPGGMYDTLRPDLLTASLSDRKRIQRDPTYVVSWDLFQRNAFPYLEVRRPFILGTQEHKWKATIAHYFFELLSTKTSKLTRLYTQNIDGLEQQCVGLPKDRIVPVHGTLAQVACEGCGHEMELDSFCNELKSKIRNIYQDPNVSSSAPDESTPIVCTSCNKPLIKPTTVLFGRSLPHRFFELLPNDMDNADLLLVAGTSLVVSPANSLVQLVSDAARRVVVNMEPVGEELGLQFGNLQRDKFMSNGDGGNGNNGSDQDYRDLFLQGTCDEVFLQLIQELGWMSDLQQKLPNLPQASQDLIQSVSARK
jgi:NAD+-dependent protein deacetylase sirtuin 2